MSTVESPSGPLPIDNQKERLRIYTDYAPAMLAYKEEIYKCVYEDDHDFILQRMPEKPDQIQYKATCGHMYCKAENGVFEFNTYRVSIERKNNNDPANPLRQCIPLQPLHKFSPALMKWPNGMQKRGKGKDDQHWLCLVCLEDLWMEATGFLDTSVDQYDLPKIHDLSILKPEYRSQGRNDHLYHLSSPQAYAVEKWAAVMRFYHPYIDYAAAGCIPGWETNTLYENVETRNLRGLDATTGVLVEVSVANVKGRFLSDVLAAVDIMVEQVRQDALGAGRAAQSITTSPPTRTNGGSTTADNGDGDVQMAEASTPSVIAISDEGTPRQRRNPRRDRKPTRRLAEN